MTTTLGAGMGIIPELLLQEAIVVGLGALAQDRRAISEMFSRDDQLRNNRFAEWRAALTTSLLEMITPGGAKCADVLLSYPVPMGKARLPAISIVTENEGENPGETVAGDVLRQSVELVGADDEAWLTTELGAGQRTTVQVSTWTPTPAQTLVLHAAVRWALYRTKQTLIAKGVHDLSFTGSGFEPNPDLEPRVAYVPMLSVTLGWTFRESFREKVPNRITFLPGKFTA